MDKKNSNNHSIFLHFLWLFSIVATGLGYVYNLGFFYHIYKYDISHLTLVIYFIFICLCLKMAWFTWRVDGIERCSIEKETKNFAETIGVFNSIIQYVGIVGTSLGIAIGFNSFGGGDKADLMTKVGTSIYNIVISTGFYAILTIMCHHVVRSIKRKYDLD
jgi:hypothetical protein